MFKRNPLAVAACAAACVTVLAACGGGQQTAGSGADATTQAGAAQSPTGSATAGSTDGAAQPVTIKVRQGDPGTYLVDGSGKTVYLFTQDEPGVSNCSGQCIENWPAVSGQPQAGSAVNEGDLGTIQRDNGTTQVTYAGHPLYYFVKDAEPGQTTGQGVNDVWYLVSPDGSAIKPQQSGTGY